MINNRRIHANIVSLWISAFIVAAVIVGVLEMQVSHNQVDSYVVTTDKNYYDVMYDLRFAVSDENFNITAINHIGEVIAERNNHAAYPHYAVISACNLEIAKKFLDIDPEFIAYMPCRIAVWEQLDEINIMTELLPEDDARCGQLCIHMNQRLKKIIDYAAK